jgi:2,3-dihydroxybenzoate decarboxylase
MVLSCAAPCIQSFADPDEAAAMAVTVNNRLAAAIANNTERFGAFASLAMHNATVAAQELRRTVTKLGFLGVLLNDYQQSGADGGELSWFKSTSGCQLLTQHILPETPLYYDQPEYDIFWQTLTELDVPFYIHPRVDINPTLSFQYGHAPFLIGPAHQFTATLSGHVLGYELRDVQIILFKDHSSHIFLACV